MIACKHTALIALLMMAAVSTQYCEALRLLKQAKQAVKSPLRQHFKDDTGDASGYLAYANARSFVPGASKANKQALTPEAAEAASNNMYNGVYRNMAAGNRLTYATVEADPVSNNPDRRKEVIQPRARSAIDLVGIVPDTPNLSSGATQFNALTMGVSAFANTYEGALSASASDSVMVNQGGSNTVIANSMLTATTSYQAAASTSGSFGTTANPLTAMALSGNPNGRLQIAQADLASAMAQTETVSATNPISRTAWQD